MTVNEIVDVVNNRIKELGTNKYQLAQKSGVRSSTILRWLRKDGQPNLMTLIIILDNLGLKLEVVENGKAKETDKNLSGNH